MKKLQVTRNPKREDVELIVGTDRITVMVGSDLDDSELANLKDFALKVAEKCGKDKVILRYGVTESEDGTYEAVEVSSTALSPEPIHA